VMARPLIQRTSLMLRAAVAGTLSLLVLAEPLTAQPAQPAGTTQREQSALERVRASGRLRVGIDATYPPFGIAEGGEFSGFDVDIARAIARELRVEAELVNASFDGVFPALQNGSFDAVISAVTITPERSATMLFSDPYIAAGQQIVVRADSAVTGPEALSGRIVGVQINTTAQFAMEKRPGVTLAKYNTVDLALLDLQHGRVDAVASDGPVLRYMIGRSFPGLKTVGAEYTDEQFGVVFARGSDDLRRAVNAALWRLQDSGDYAKIYGKWFGAAAERGAASASPRAFDPDIVARTWSFFLRGVRMTAVMAVSSLMFGLPLGLALALARVQSKRLVSTPAAVYVEVMRGTPLLVQILFVYFVLPSVGVNLPAYASGILALTLNASAYISEVIRAGILSVDPGQMEAARALGMSYWQAMRRIILPQTFRRVVPPLTNEGIALLKDSSLVSVIGLTELARTGQELASRYAAPLTIWPLVAILYLALTFPLTRVAEYLERRWSPATKS
jgi:arginine/lysine/histidine/glutamine transport system substrate-binding and permease protein